MRYTEAQDEIGGLGRSLVTQGFVGHVTKSPKCNLKALWIDWIGQSDQGAQGKSCGFVKASC